MAILCQSKDLEKNMNYLGHSAEMCMSTREWGEGGGSHNWSFFEDVRPLRCLCERSVTYILGLYSIITVHL